jgi:hypothetical protein
MGILGTRLGWRLPCLNIVRKGRSLNGCCFYKALKIATDAIDPAVKPESDPGTEKLLDSPIYRRDNYAKWTPEEIRQVYELHDDGLNHDAIAARLSGRSYGSVAWLIRLRASSAPVAVRPRAWSPEESQELLALKESGVPLREIKKKFPLRTEASVKQKLQNIKSEIMVVKAHDGTGQGSSLYRHWTDEDITLLHRLAQRGLTMSEVAEKLSRTVASIDKKFRRINPTNEIWPSYSR